MATVRNYIDALLQAAGTRIADISMPSNILVDTPNVATGLQANIDSQRNVIFRQATDPGVAAVNYDMWQDTSVTPNVFKIKIAGVWQLASTINQGIFATLSGQVTSGNYATYLGANAISDTSFSQNTGMDASSAYTTLNLDSDGLEVVVVLFGQMVTRYNATSGHTAMDMLLTVGGVTKYSKASCLQFPNQASADPISVGYAHSFKLSPGSGLKAYQLTVTAQKTGDGTGGTVGYPTIQCFWLKR